MKKDIIKPEVKQVTLAVTCKKGETDQEEWHVHLINKNSFALENTLVTSKGYGKKNGKAQKTSILRHFLETVPAESTVMIEPIDPRLFHLSNEYWLSYYIGQDIFDKKFVFLPESIKKENLIHVELLGAEAVLHS